MNNKRDYYEVLGVERQASEQAIKSAYRKLALQYHPDRNPDNTQASEEKFKELTEAYSVLADSEKRAAYDQFGLAGVRSSGGGWNADFNASIFSDFEDIFGEFFGFGGFGRQPGRRRRPARGADLQYNLEISLEEAARGLETKIKIPRTDNCPVCRGTGSKPGSEPATCHLRRARPDSTTTEHLHRVAHLPALPGHGSGHPRGLCGLPGQGADSTGKSVKPEDSRWRGGREPSARERRRRSGTDGWTARRSLRGAARPRASLL